MMAHIDKIEVAVDWADGEDSTGVVLCDGNKVIAAQSAAAFKTMTDGISRSYFGGDKRFVQWFNSDTEELLYVPEVSLCDEIFLIDEPDYAYKLHEIELLEIGESCVVEENMCIIMRVK